MPAVVEEEEEVVVVVMMGLPLLFCVCWDKGSTVPDEVVVVVVVVVSPDFHWPPFSPSAREMCLPTSSE